MEGDFTTIPLAANERVIG